MSIVLENLVKRYGSHTVVDRVSMEVEEGELLVLLGPSGSGKSTVLRMIAGLVPIDDGRVVLEGSDVTDLPPQERNVGFVFQSYALFPHLTVAENVEFALAVREVPRAERVARRDELLALVGLAGFGGRDVRRMSGGQQQRVAVARALAHEPSVLLLDEPFGALDVQIRGQLRRALRELQRRVGVTTILVTHDQEEAFELADRIGVIEQGRLLEIGEPEELYRRPRHEFVAGFLGEANLLGVRPENGHLPLGPLSLPLPDVEAEVPGRWAVVIRPEDVVLAHEGETTEAPRLGTGEVEEVLVLGDQRRLRLRLAPIQGAWPLGTGYGGSGVPIVATAIPGPDGEVPFRVGDRLEIGVRRTHVIARVGLRVLLLADGSPEFDVALTAAATIVQSLGGKLAVLAVADDVSALQRLTTAVKDTLAARSPGTPIEPREGRSAREVLREAQGQRHDLVVVPGWGPATDPYGTRREAGLAIARQAPCPVLVARGGSDPMRRVLLCTAAGEAGKADVVFGGRLARATGAEATLFHVEPAEGTDSDSVEWVRRHMSEGAETLRAQGAHARTRVGRGDVVQAILREAAQGAYDLIVVGGHERGSWSGPERDIASELLDRADRSVLVVKLTNGRAATDATIPH